jgi:DNA polymerase III alpha subunit (gram-positive type)
MILFFDTETTGLPPKDSNWETSFNNFPHIVQIAWMITDDNGAVLYKHDNIIKPTGYDIPKETIDLHGITQDIAEQNGMDAKIVLNHFLIDALACEKIVGHNIYFDTSIIKANMLRLLFDKDPIVKALDKTKRIDTMRMIKVGKWPKLSELYKTLFSEELSGAHNAMGDVVAVSRCYFKLKESV